MKIQMTNRNYSIECNCDFENLTIKEIDDLEKIIKELQDKFKEVKKIRLKNVVQDDKE